MYTGTMIQDLMATVERAEKRAQFKQYADEIELQQLFDLPVATMHSEPVFAGAA